MINRYKAAATKREIVSILLLANLIHFAKKKGHGHHHGPPAPPPVNPPPPVDPGPTDPPPGGSSDLNFGSVGKYNPLGHPYTDFVPVATLPTTLLHTEYGFDTSGAPIGAFVDVNLIDLGSRSTNTASINSAIEAARVLNQNTRINLPSPFPCYAPECKEITNAGKWIYIQGADPCPAGQRTNPSLMTNAPEFMVQGVEETAIYFWRKAKRYYIKGCKFSMNPTLNHAYFLIPTFPRESSQEFLFTPADECDELIFDRCLVQGLDDGTGEGGRLRIGIFLCSARSAVVNCWIHQISEIGGESKGIITTNTTGATKVVNNYVEAASIGYLTGGEIPKYGAVIGRPEDIELRRNFFTRRLQWAKNNAATWDEVNGRGVKTLIEFKNVNRALVEGNILHANWADAQSGMALIVKSGTGDGGLGAGCGSENVTIRYNKIFGSVRCWNFAALSDELDAIPASKTAVYDNLAYDIGTFAGQTSGLAWLLTNAFDDLYVRHNTLIHNEFVAGNIQMVNVGNPRSQRFFWLDNITTIGSPDIGLFSDGGKVGNEALNNWAENPTWLRNILIGADSFIETLGPPNTTFVPTVAAMNFNNAAGNDYSLTPASPGWQAGVNGKNLGADMTKVNLATSGVDS